MQHFPPKLYKREGCEICRFLPVQQVLELWLSENRCFSHFQLWMSRMAACFCMLKENRIYRRIGVQNVQKHLHRWRAICRIVKWHKEAFFLSSSEHPREEATRRSIGRLAMEMFSISHFTLLWGNTEIALFQSGILLRSENEKVQESVTNWEWATTRYKKLTIVVGICSPVWTWLPWDLLQCSRIVAVDFSDFLIHCASHVCVRTVNFDTQVVVCDVLEQKRKFCHWTWRHCCAVTQISLTTFLR